MISKNIFDTYFSCFSKHPVVFRGVSYATAEHAYHVQRYEDESIIEEVKNAPTARDAWSVSQRYKSEQKKDFGEHKREIMKEILQAKLAQHTDVASALIATGTEDILKEEPLDAYWGTGPDGNGRNELGKLWMELRSKMQSA